MKGIKYLLLGLFTALSSCNLKENRPEGYNRQMSELIFSKSELKNALNLAFDLEEKGNRVFKVVISRRNQFVRVTIYQLFGKEEFKEVPSSYFVYKTNTFICYDGSELIDNKILSEKFVERLKIKTEVGVIYHSRVIQFDIGEDKKIRLNIPAINPYDFDLTESHKLLFPRPANKDKKN